MTGTIGPSDISREKVLARLGYAQGKTLLDPQTSNLIDEELAGAFRLITPRQVVALSPVTLIGDGVALNPGFSIASAAIRDLLAGCAEAAGFAVTIGKNLEEKRSAYGTAGEHTRALILDAIGSVITEELAERTHRQIAADAAQRSLAATRRFSPGYGDWRLEGQKAFLVWLGASRIGIKLNPASLMFPEKSVTALLGLKAP